MTCYYPKTAYDIGERTAAGKRKLVFKKPAMPKWREVEQIQLPCGRCVGCQQDTADGWAVRCVHESRYHDHTYFVTLTYNDECLPHDMSLNNRDYQTFLKRLRYHAPQCDIRYLLAGEYGGRTQRPHFHLILFGVPLHGRSVGKSEAGFDMYVDPALEECWGQGFANFGEFNIGTARYVAKYLNKKKYGDEAERVDPHTGLKHYERINWVTGEITEVMPEFIRASKNPALGLRWFEKYGLQDVYLSGDFIMLDGLRFKAPRYYDRLLERNDPDLYQEIKAKRAEAANEPHPDRTPERLNDRAQAITYRRKKSKGYARAQN